MTTRFLYEEPAVPKGATLTIVPASYEEGKKLEFELLEDKRVLTWQGPLKDGAQGGWRDDKGNLYRAYHNEHEKYGRVWSEKHGCIMKAHNITYRTFTIVGTITLPTWHSVEECEMLFDEELGEWYVEAGRAAPIEAGIEWLEGNDVRLRIITSFGNARTKPLTLPQPPVFPEGWDKNGKTNGDTSTTSR